MRTFSETGVFSFAAAVVWVVGVGGGGRNPRKAREHPLAELARVFFSALAALTFRKFPRIRRATLFVCGGCSRFVAKVIAGVEGRRPLAHLEDGGEAERLLGHRPKQLVAKFLYRAVSFLPVEGHRLEDDGVDGHGHLLVKVGGGREIPLRHAAGHHLVEGNGKGVDVRPRIDIGGIAGLLRRHVIGGPDGSGGTGLHGLVSGHDVGDAKVTDLDLPLGTNEDVRGLDIPVDDATFVDVFEGVATGGDHIAPIHRFKCSVDDLSVQVLAVDVFHDEEVDIFLCPAINDGHDVGVGKGSERARFRLEAFDEGFIASKAGVQGLDGDEAIQALLPCLIDDGHPTLADLLDDLVVISNGLPRLQIVAGCTAPCAGGTICHYLDRPRVVKIPGDLILTSLPIHLLAIPCLRPILGHCLVHSPAPLKGKTSPRARKDGILLVNYVENSPVLILNFNRFSFSSSHWSVHGGKRATSASVF